MTASVIISIFALAVLSTTCVAVTVFVSRALADAFRAIDRMHKRSAEHQGKLLDRFIALDFEKLYTLQVASDDGDEGGFISPEDQGDDDEEHEQEIPKPAWGSLTALRERLTDEERELLEEDFDAEGDSVR